MKVFEVFLNGERLCLAGISGRCVLTVIIDHVKGKIDPVDDVDLQVGGLISDTDEHVTWNRTHLQTGDEIRVTILESDSVPAAEPTHAPAVDVVAYRGRFSEAQELRFGLHMLSHMHGFHDKGKSSQDPADLEP